jgi:hypothetical protein
MAGGMAFGGSHQQVPLTMPQRSDSEGAHLLPLHLRVLLHRLRLDKDLLGGASPRESAELSCRARQLQRARGRRALAKNLDRTIAQVERYRRADTAGLPLNRNEVLRARPLLLQLSEQLRGPEAVSPRGVLLVRWLLGDASSPVFSPEWSRARSKPGELERQARIALAALGETRSDDDRPGADPRSR